MKHVSYLKFCCKTFGAIFKLIWLQKNLSKRPETAKTGQNWSKMCTLYFTFCHGYLRFVSVWKCKNCMSRVLALLKISMSNFWQHFQIDTIAKNSPKWPFLLNSIFCHNLSAWRKKKHFFEQKRQFLTLFLHSNQFKSGAKSFTAKF